MCPLDNNRVQWGGQEKAPTIDEIKEVTQTLKRKTNEFLKFDHLKIMIFNLKMREKC